MNDSVCWAQPLGGCGDGRSREHVVSDGILSLFSDLTVAGFPWCRDTPKRVGPGSLVAKDLCSRHNSRLSPADSAAATLFRVLRDQYDPAKPGYTESVIISTVDLERWFLKTSINMVLQEPSLPSWPYPVQGSRVPLRLVEAAFGVSPLQPPCGLYWRGHVRQSVVSEDRLDLRALFERDDVLGGFRWSFRGAEYLLWIDPSKSLVETSPEKTVLAGGAGSSLMYRPKRMSFLRDKKPFCSILFQSRPLASRTATAGGDPSA